MPTRPSHPAPPTRWIRLLGLACTLLALPLPLLSAAPFTPAVFLSLLLMPLATWAAWRGAWRAGALTLLLCLLSWVSSPLVAQAYASLPQWLMAIAGLQALLLAGVVAWQRPGCGQGQA